MLDDRSLEIRGEFANWRPKNFNRGRGTSQRASTVSSAGAHLGPDLALGRCRRSSAGGAGRVQEQLDELGDGAPAHWTTGVRGQLRFARPTDAVTARNDPEQENAENQRMYQRKHSAHA